MKILCNFSCGATSAMATYMTIQKYGVENCEIVYCATGSEHPDNNRFLNQCENLFGKFIIILKSEKYDNLDECLVGARMINSPRGAACTRELKIAPVNKFRKEKFYDINILGYHSQEVDRAVSYILRNPKLNAEFPLIDAKLSHADALAFIKALGIELPVMYSLGYRNNNCIGCVKGGMGYWNKIRKDFPETFARRATQERIIGHTCIRGIFLDELDTERGVYDSEPEVECDGMCWGLARKESEVQIACSILKGKSEIRL